MESTERPPIDRWHPIRERQRQEIAEALIATVTGHPQEAVTVGVVAAAAGISRKTFYKYFRSLDDAMAAAAEVALRDLGLPGDEPPAGANGLERFLATVDRLMHGGLERPELVRFLSHFDFAYRGRLDDEVEQAFSRSVDEVYRSVGETFAEGQRDGSIRPDLDPVVTVAAAGNAAMGLVQRIVSFPLDADMSAIVRMELEAWRGLVRSS